MNEKYLPIGTVVKLQNDDDKFMITGYLQVDTLKVDKVYDYSGCHYPEGVLATDQNYLFNHSDISEVCSLGLQDEEQKKFNQSLKNNMTEENIKIILENAKAKYQQK